MLWPSPPATDQDCKQLPLLTAPFLLKYFSLVLHHADLQKQVAELAGVVAAGKAQFDEKSGRLEELKARLKECDKGGSSTAQRPSSFVQCEGLRFGHPVLHLPEQPCCKAAGASLLPKQHRDVHVPTARPC